MHEVSNNLFIEKKKEPSGELVRLGEQKFAYITLLSFNILIA